MKQILALCTALLLVGCASPTMPPDSAQQIDIYRNESKPARSYRELGTLTDSGALHEQGDIESKMIKRAQKMNGDAILFEPRVKDGGEVQGFSYVDTYLYRGKVVAYE